MGNTRIHLAVINAKSSLTPPMISTKLKIVTKSRKSATAYALDMLTKNVALQYGKQGIRCNCVRPGPIVTPQNDAHVPQALKDIFLNNICVTRYGKSTDIANLCVYLASDESEFVTGLTNIYGGQR